MFSLEVPANSAKWDPRQLAVAGYYEMLLYHPNAFQGCRDLLHAL
jgi:hypothetical protein